MTHRFTRFAAWLLGLGLITALDAPLVRALHAMQPAQRGQELLQAAKSLGTVPVWLLAAAGLFLVDRATLGRAWRRWTGRGLTLVVAILSAGITAEAMKMLIRRQRPDRGIDVYTFRDYLDRPFYGGGLGMPSSHMAVAFAGLFLAMRLFPAARPVWWTLGLAVAFQRIASLAHFPSDVYVGITVGWLGMLFAWELHRRCGSGPLAQGLPVAAAAPARARTLPPDWPPALEPAGPAHSAPGLSVLVPAHNEEPNLARLVNEVDTLRQEADLDLELLIIDDGSTDGTQRLLRRMGIGRPWLRTVRLLENRGQSLALGVGVAAARGKKIAILDADGQNDPADLPQLLRAFDEPGVDFVQGMRANRQDTWSKRQASRIGRTARRLVLADPVADTGCSLRVVDARFARLWPLDLHGMHRFLPAHSAMHGAVIREVPVNHRLRQAGTSHYGSLQRGFVGFFDLLAVRWMLSRHRDTPGLLGLSDAERPTRATETGASTHRGVVAGVA